MIIIFITLLHIALTDIITAGTIPGTTIIPGTIFTIHITGASLITREQSLLKIQKHILLPAEL
jgi:hypothetical protein